jgi:uncharacterized repeat protein (TIGR03837 family)
MHYSSIDIFCHVVDNFGDIGVVYRFAKEFLLTHPKCRVRVFCDDFAPLSLLCPDINVSADVQDYHGVGYINSSRLTTALARILGPTDVVVEAFGCDIPKIYLDELLPSAALWINLEHLSAEQWVSGYHCRQSLLKGKTKKFFYMPGFTENTGGVIVDSAIENTRHNLVSNRSTHLNGFLGDFGLQAGDLERNLFGVVFSYTRGFDILLRDIRNTDRDVYLFVMGNKTVLGMRATLNRANAQELAEDHFVVGNVHVLVLPFLPQSRFDELLCLTDFNFVRGEDSLVRAILAGKPFIWSAYIQENRYHRVKVEALCGVMRRYFTDDSAFEEYRKLLIDFNDVENESPIQASNERYGPFFRDLKKIEYSTTAMSYFITRNCSLIGKFTRFLSGI